jgi:hypothetical protein
MDAIGVLGRKLLRFYVFARPAKRSGCQNWMRSTMAAVADIGIRIDADVPIRRDRRSACRDEDREIVSTLTMQSLPWRKAGRLASS